MMRTLCKIFTALMFVFYMMPSHAIDAKYSKQLERSGCTELTDGNGCDIHKTKAQNGIGSSNVEDKEIQDFIKYSVINQKTDAAYEALEGYGWQNNEPAIWTKGQRTMILSIQNDIIVNASVK